MTEIIYEQETETQHNGHREFFFPPPFVQQDVPEGMSHEAFVAMIQPPFLVAIPDWVPDEDLPEEDGLPLETKWHVLQMFLLITLMEFFWRARTDIFVGGNMFIYFRAEDALGGERQRSRGPDFFLVKGCDGRRERRTWKLWEEQGRTPNIIIELVSDSTKGVDEHEKFNIYQDIFQTPEYILYYPNTEEIVGWRLHGGVYTRIATDDRGWWWSEELELWLGVWRGSSLHPVYATWLRFFHPDGQLVLTETEYEAQIRQQAEEQARHEAQARQQAEEQARKAEEQARESERQMQAIQAELERLRATMAQQKTTADE